MKVISYVEAGEWEIDLTECFPEGTVVSEDEIQKIIDDGLIDIQAGGYVIDKDKKAVSWLDES